MTGEALYQLSPLSALTGGPPSGNAEDDIVNITEDGIWHVMRARGLRSQIVGDVLGAGLPQQVLVFVDNYC